MNQKLVLDILMGAVIPILILNNLNEQLGTEITYVLAALVPVAWVLIDLLFVTKRFNFITSYIGAFAVMRGILAFWFVDGIKFAFKDSLGSLAVVIVFGSSIMMRKPIMYYFLRQGLNPQTPEQKKSLDTLLAESRVYRSLVQGTMILLIVNLWIGIANFSLNLRIVISDFGTAMFNQQVAQVNAIARTALAIPEYIGIGITAILIRRAILSYLPKENNNEDDSDFWELLQLREHQKIATD